MLCSWAVGPVFDMPRVMHSPVYSCGQTQKAMSTGVNGVVDMTFTNSGLGVGLVVLSPPGFLRVYWPG